MIDYTPFPVSDLNPEGVEVSRIPGTGACVFSFPKGEGRLWVEMKDDALDGLSLDGDRWIAMDVTCEGTRAAVFSWFFETADGRFCGVKMGVLPGIRTRIALPISVAEGKQLFLRRTPGKLKSVTQGQPIDYRDAVRFVVRSERAPEDVTFRIDAFRIYDGEPDFPVETRTLVDEMGQKALADWPGKTKSFEEMAARMHAILDAPPPKREDDGRSRWGGDLSLRLTDGTGFFTLEKWQDRWLLADPDGYAFFSTGLDCVNIDGDANLEGIRSLAGDLDPKSAGWVHGEFFSWHRHNLWRVFGDDYNAKWKEMTARRMVRWGFNTVACWSDIAFAEEYDIPHVTIMHGYPKTETYIFRDFPDTLSPEFAENAKTWARQMERHRGKASLIGYFLGNEPQWAFVNNLNIAAYALECEKTSYSRRALIDFMREKYGTIDALNAEWGADYASFADMDRPVSTLGFTEAGKRALRAFSEIMIREYIRIPSEAIRAVDPDHLNLGIRYAWLSSKELAAGSEYTDVFSFNCYSMDPTPAIESFSRLVGKPVMIGEFHFGALDRGLDATGIRGVTSQRERGRAYRYYMQHAAAHPMCLGAHYFTLNDQAYLGRFDGENYQIGIVDVTQRPYEDFEEGIIETHRELYEIAEGKRPADAEPAEEIPAIFF
ncbi:MAG: beta-galactosidase [Clostridia bacterium]|nr:beta-galactosidase [Clostridia bacterium]